MAESHADIPHDQSLPVIEVRGPDLFSGPKGLSQSNILYAQPVPNDRIVLNFHRIELSAVIAKFPGIFLLGMYSPLIISPGNGIAKNLPGSLCHILLPLPSTG